MAKTVCLVAVVSLASIMLDVDFNALFKLSRSYSAFIVTEELQFDWRENSSEPHASIETTSSLASLISLNKVHEPWPGRLLPVASNIGEYDAHKTDNIKITRTADLFSDIPVCERKYCPHEIKHRILFCIKSPATNKSSARRDLIRESFVRQIKQYPQANYTFVLSRPDPGEAEAIQQEADAHGDLTILGHLSESHKVGTTMKTLEFFKLAVLRPSVVYDWICHVDDDSYVQVSGQRPSSDPRDPRAQSAGTPHALPVAKAQRRRKNCAERTFRSVVRTEHHAAGS